MISASHNSYQDNGIKLFGPNGYKLSDEIELEIESRMDRALDDKLAAHPPILAEQFELMTRKRAMWKS